mmetsp:Transcript_146141/g.467000  ORF Transcript_146141/g.467000 Transcript_146141/m.467000 type:complete len:108 (-) Transcript_146141:8-331(-)
MGFDPEIICERVFYRTSSGIAPPISGRIAVARHRAEVRLLLPSGAAGQTLSCAPMMSLASSLLRGAGSRRYAHTHASAHAQWLCVCVCVCEGPALWVLTCNGPPGGS